MTQGDGRNFGIYPGSFGARNDGIEYSPASAEATSTSGICARCGQQLYSHAVHTCPGYWTVPVATPYSGGYTCSCGTWVPYGTVHWCNTQTSGAATLPKPLTTEERLTEIERILKRLEAKYLDGR